MNLDDLPPPEIMCEGKFVRLLKRGKWEYASRAGGINAVVILAEHFPRSEGDINEIPDKLIEL